MSEILKSFLNPDGSTSWINQQNAGAWEAKTYSQSAAQQSHESWTAYTQRIGSFWDTKKSG